MEINYKFWPILFMLTIILFFSGCGVKTIEEVKIEKYIGKKVKVEGMVTTPIKIGDENGFILKDKNQQSIGIVSDEIPLPTEKKYNFVVKGKLEKHIIFGYYIRASKIK